MSIEWTTFGHSRVKKVLESFLEIPLFSGSLIFLGEESLGKKTLAVEFSAKFLNSGKVFSHPDFYYLDLGGDEIGVEKAREITLWLSGKPFVGQRKIAVINNAENLNQQSSNIFLKSLEEMAAGTVVVFVSRVKPVKTIVSRSLVFHFYPFSEEESTRFEKLFPVESSQRHILNKIGKPGFFAAGGKEKEKMNFLFKEIENSEAALKKNIANRLIKVQELGGWETTDLKNLFGVWLTLEKRALAENPEKYLMTRKILIALNDLKKNLNKKLILQKLFV